jgi:hypothetical protein
MDFNDYVNQLSNLDNQEIRAELENFYFFNSGLLQFFKAIDNQVKMILNSPNLNSKSVELIQSQVNDILPILNKLKFEISMFDPEKLSEEYKETINKTITYAKDFMVTGEVQVISNQLFDLLRKNELAFLQEQEECKRREQEEKEHIAREEIERKTKEEWERKETEEAERKEKEKNFVINTDQILNVFYSPYYLFKRNNLYGMFHKNTGKIIIYPQYDLISYDEKFYHSGFAILHLNNKKGVFYVPNEKSILDCMFDEVVILSNDGGAMKIHDKWGFFGTEKRITDCNFEKIYSWFDVDGIACVGWYGNDKTFIDKSGHEIGKMQQLKYKLFDKILNSPILR